MFGAQQNAAKDEAKTRGGKLGLIACRMEA